ncbi:MAG: NAD(P)-dependent alcohol dehydrogenase [Acidipropionibacterium sp.]|nr:NAD(P)-dependent alcohol dehydrogenase [Acidipropionibacterium sp.]
MRIPAYVATSATGPLVPGTIERREIGPKDVLIDIAWAGVCHSDIHTVHGDWGPVPYPLTVGHEIAGTVARTGAEVTRFHAGERVGVGTMVDSCRTCANCRDGLEQYCLNGNTQTYASVDRDGTITQGGYSTRIVVDEDFVLHLPEQIPFEKAAPLLCAGITTYSPLRHWGAGPGKRVAIVGLGGLGHMGVQLAHAMGAEVTVLSRTLAKRDDGLRLGADHYCATSDPATFNELAGSLDLIVNTVSAPLDVDAYLSLLSRDGSLVNVGAPSQPMGLHVQSLLGARRSYAGSATGSIAETQEMLDFCAEHGVAPEVEIIPIEQVNEAWRRVLASDVRFRFVIDMSTLSR